MASRPQQRVQRGHLHRSLPVKTQQEPPAEQHRQRSLPQGFFNQAVRTANRAVVAAQQHQPSSVANAQPSEIDWFKDVEYAVRSGRWENVRGNLRLCVSSRRNAARMKYQLEQESKSAGVMAGFWNAKQSQQQQQQLQHQQDRSKGLLKKDGQERTPLHCALGIRKAASKPPADVVKTMVQLEPRITAEKDGRGRLPIHLAVIYKHPVEVIAPLVDTFPASLSALDEKGQSPLGYAVDAAKSETELLEAPKTFWMATSGLDEGGKGKESSVEQWQQDQSERWGIVHYILLSFATYPQNLSVLVAGKGGQGKSSLNESKQPMLVDALLYAAPPAVIMLLIGASVMLLSVENKASAFAGSTLYSCIARHYPLSILQSLTMQCPKDVRTVKDETGMGLVSAQFISGCFDYNVLEEKWNVNTRMLSALERSVEKGELYKDDPAFVDWWHKIEYLISFCDNTAGDDEQQQQQEVKREYLLHHALCNPDIPPRVIRLLVALYPKSITLQNPAISNTLPIHLAAQYHEYIPRLYEYLIMGDDISALGMLLQANPESINYRHDRRLPFHIAIGAGKTYSSLRLFLGDERDSGRGNGRRCRILEERDPQTGLYPFQLAATYTAVSSSDGYRWSCIARNKHSHTGWKILTDREKASAIFQVSQSEDKERLSTVFELLRRNPHAISSAVTRKKESASTYRNECGIGMSSSHFLSFCYTKRKGAEWETNRQNTQIFVSALRAAKHTGLSRVPAFFKWWRKMKFWIRYCDPPRGNSKAKLLRRALPRNDDDYLLHAALTNPDTPPPVVQLLLQLFPMSPQRRVLTSWLPLHITCLTSSYTPRPCEDVEQSSLEFTLNAFPEAARCFADKGLPLHLAIRSGRTWEELWYLVKVEPRALKVRDPETKLYPFQMLCMRRSHTAEQALQYRYVARNWFTESKWEEMSPVGRVREIRKARKGHELAILSSAYEILRSDTTVIENYNKNYRDERVKATTESALPTVTAEIFGLRHDDEEVSDLEDSHGADLESSTEDDAASDASVSLDSGGNAVEQNSEFTPSRNTHGADDQQRPSLMKFFSREQAMRRQQSQRSVFECDASVLSGVDVMSLVSNTGQGPQKPRRGGRRVRRTASSGSSDDDGGEEVIDNNDSGKQKRSLRGVSRGKSVHDLFLDVAKGQDEDTSGNYDDFFDDEDDDYICLADLEEI